MEKVVLTRPRGQNQKTAEILEAAGVPLIEVPLIALESTGAEMPIPGSGELILFTSARAVEEVARRGLIEALRGCEVAAVGPATAAALTRAGRPPDRTPRDATAAALLAALEGRGSLAGRRIHYPCAAETSGEVEEAAERAGASLIRTPLYRNTCPSGAAVEMAGALPAAVIALASGSAARHLAALSLPLGGAKIAVIGPSTAETCREVGLPVDASADPHTAEGLAEGILLLLRERTGRGS